MMSLNKTTTAVLCLVLSAAVNAQAAFFSVVTPSMSVQNSKSHPLRFDQDAVVPDLASAAFHPEMMPADHVEVLRDVTSTEHRSVIESIAHGLDGEGLNEADKHLMTLYFQASTPEMKHRLLSIREILFDQGSRLAQKGIEATGASLQAPVKETAAEAIVRVRTNLNRWYRWALAYAVAYKKDHPIADEDNKKLVGKSISDEIDQDIYHPLLTAVDEIEALIQKGEINPTGVTLKLSRNAPEPSTTISGRPARVAFLPMKGDPWQVGHIFVMIEAIAKAQVDQVVIMVDNSDPERKPNLSSLTIREPITLALLKVLTPFVHYTPIAKEEDDLRKADGERSIFRLMEFNRTVPIEWFYMVGSDHRHWEVRKNDKVNPDTAKKLHDFIEAKTDGYAGQKLGVIFIERKGEEFKDGEIESLRVKSGIEAISKIEQPMDTSSTRVRKDKHWWTVPNDVFGMAEFFRFWEVQKASRVSRSEMLTAA